MIVMNRIYPPVWCKDQNCSECNFIECDSKVLSLIMPYKYPRLSFEKRPRIIEITSMAIYFGFCERLAKFFLMFPQSSPLSIVRNNFVNSETGLPTDVSIPRILLDMLNHGDPAAPTDDVHKLRLMFSLKATDENIGRIIGGEKEDEITISKKELDSLMKRVKIWAHDLFKDRLISFEKTKNLDRCRYCFLDDCEQI